MEQAMFSLKDKVVVITGGGSGIGRAISLLFADRGAYVFVLDTDEVGAEKLRADIVQKGGRSDFKKCDISKREEVSNAISLLVASAGRIDIVVNNAGIAHVGNVENTSAADFDKLFNINVKGVYHIINSCIPHMKERGGVVLNMASTAASVGLSDRFAYSMTKSAVRGITLSVARDYLQYNIRCNSISPGRVHTPFVDGFIAKNYPGKEEEMFINLSLAQPIGRMGKPEEIAWLALYLCSDEASFTTGNDYAIDGGVINLNS